jgi:hypothetical protein
MKNLIVLSCAVCLLAACATPPAGNPAATPAPATAASKPGPAAGPVRIVKSRDGSYDGEVVGTPAPDSKFAQLQIGMSGPEVNTLMGRMPDRSHTYETGKRWIPFYYGNDAIRMQVLFNGEGCLIYATGNRFNLTNPDLIRIEVDPSGACYQP